MQTQQDFDPEWDMPRSPMGLIGILTWIGVIGAIIFVASRFL